MPKVEDVKVKCKSCGGTGIYRGFAERDGVGVVCYSCDGTGAADLWYEPFTERVRRDDVEVVARNCGWYLTRERAQLIGGVTYEEFLQGKMPERLDDDEVSRRLDHTRTEK